MTIDEFEIGKWFLENGHRYLCVDKGVKTIVYVCERDHLKINEPDYWLTLGGHELSKCTPVGDREMMPPKAVFDFASALDKHFCVVRDVIDDLYEKNAEFQRELKRFRQ